MKGVTRGNVKRQYELLVEDINKRGGIAGRRVELVFHRVDGASNDSTDVTSEAICATFTEDDPVYAVIVAGDENLKRCVRKAGAVQVGNNLSNEDDKLLRSVPSYASPAGISLTRVAKGTARPAQPARLLRERRQVRPGDLRRADLRPRDEGALRSGDER